MKRERFCPLLFILLLFPVCFSSLKHTLLSAQTAIETSAPAAQGESAIHLAARTGDLELLRSELQRGISPNVKDESGRTPLIEAVSGGHLSAVRLLLASGADVNARTRAGRTAVIEAAAQGRFSIARELVKAGADLNINERGWGTALEVAERSGHNQIGAMLRQSGAKSSGRSPGDKVCVRPWGGEGYCGTVLSVDRTKLQVRITEIVECTDEGACPAKDECSAGQPVGGASGIAVGDEISIMSWCLTHTGVQP